MGHARLLLVLGLILCATHLARAVEVQSSTFSQNSIIVMLSPSEVKAAQLGGSADLGKEVANKLMALVGMPESVTGKVALLPVWLILIDKYSVDISTYVRRVEPGMSLTLKYYGVNIAALQAIWHGSEGADIFLPGGETGKALLEILNTAVNASLN